MNAPKAPPAPTPKPVATMPDDQDPAVLSAKRKQLASMAASGGRASTILTAPQVSGSLSSVGTSPLGASSTIANTGGDTYGSKTLGSA